MTESEKKSREKKYRQEGMQRGRWEEESKWPVRNRGKAKTENLARTEMDR